MKLIIFDVDGTLVDSQAHIIAAMEFAFNAADVAMPSRSEILSVVGLSLPELMVILAPDATRSKIDELVAGYRNSYATLRTQMEQPAPFYPYALETLHELNARDEVLLALATGKSRRGVRHLLDSYDLHGMFVSIQTSDTHPSKPHPSMLEQALFDGGVDAVDAIMLGDTSFDMEMACNAKIRGIGVNWGYHSADILKGVGGIETILSDFRELVPHLTNSGFLQ